MWAFKESAVPFFTPEQKKQVVAIFEAILPGGPDNPGATDVGAADYVDLLLARDASTYYEIKDWKPMYTAGLAMLSAASATRFGSRTIDAIKPTEVTALLADLAQGILPGFPTAAWQTTFFGVLRAHCIEGCFADQRWGGNRDNIMWQWYGYPTGPSVRFQRNKKGAGSLPLNPSPAGLDPAVSGNTFTAAKDPGEMQSATVLPNILIAAIANAKATEE
jgi:hypothetical protein